MVQSSLNEMHEKVVNHVLILDIAMAIFELYAILYCFDDFQKRIH